MSEEGFGNPDADLMMNCVKLEKRGIKTVLLTDEYAGRDGASQSLADANSLASAVVSAGNANELINLPPCKEGDWPPGGGQRYRRRLGRLTGGGRFDRCGTPGYCRSHE